MKRLHDCESFPVVLCNLIVGGSLLGMLIVAFVLLWCDGVIGLAYPVLLVVTALVFFNAIHPIFLEAKRKYRRFRKTAASNRILK